MKNNDMLSAFANNKKILFIAPHLLYINNLLSKYILNQEIIFFENIILLFLLFFSITTVLYFILNKIIKNNQYVFYILIFVCLTYLCKFNLSFIIQFVIYGTLIFVVMSKMLKEHFDTCISILIFIIFSYFCIGAPQNIYSLIVTGINTKTYEETYEINVDDNSLTPNIYWIHADAMMSFDTINKYFNYDNQEFLTYLNSEGYYINKNASLVAGHKTQKALAALLNPNYYDDFLKTYLYELEDTYLEKTSTTSYNVSTKELTNKRLESELLKALKEKDYTTIAISKFNNYSTLKTDIFYDFYNRTDTHWHFTEEKDLRKISEKSNDNIESSYRTTQLKEILTYSIFSQYTDNLIPYDYELIDYNDLDTSNYPILNNTNYWQAKAIIKSIEGSKTIESNKFFFIDYDLNHPGLSYNQYGMQLNPSQYGDLNSYVGNYIYSCRILTDMLNYIKTNDPDAIIIIQADHGLHTFENEDLQEDLNISLEQAQEIKNSVINAVYIPEKYQNGDEKYLSNPLNISRYIVNNYVGKNYEYLEY